MTSRRLGRALVCALSAALTACAPRPDGDWLGVCGDHLRVHLAVRTDADAQTTGRAWLLARPDDVLDFRCDVDASGRDVALSVCAGGWQADGGAAGLLPLTFDATVEEGDHAESLSGTCTWEDEEGAASLLRVAPAPDDAS